MSLVRYRPSITSRAAWGLFLYLVVRSELYGPRLRPIYLEASRGARNCIGKAQAFSDRASLL